MMIWSFLRRFLFSFGDWAVLPYIPLVAFILLTGVYRPVFSSQGWRTIVLILVILAAGYYFVYLTTPVDLKWHLESSLDRVLLQLWPSILLTLGLISRPAESHSGGVRN
jgi:hypothetical protein